MDLEKKSRIFQKKMRSFHQSVLEKRSKLGNWSSRTAVKRSVTLVASKKLKKMFLEKSIETKIGLELWKQIWESKNAWKIKKNGVSCLFQTLRRAFEKMSIPFFIIFQAGERYDSQIS